MTEFRGRISVPTGGNLDAEVFLLGQDGAVVATAHPDARGSFAVAAPAGFGGGWLLYKLYRPIVGARAVPVTAPAAGLDLTIAPGEAVPLTGTVTLPPGAPAGWLDVHLTPRAIDGLAAEPFRALLAEGPQPVRRSTYVTQRIEQDHFAWSVLPGVYRLEIERVFHDSGGARNPPVSVLLDTVDVASGPPLEAAPIGVWLTVRAPMAVAVKLKILPAEDL